MTETERPRFKSPEEAQTERELQRLEGQLKDLKAKRAGQQVEEVKVAEMLKSLHDQVETMYDQDARLFSFKMLGLIDELGKLNETIALSRYRNTGLREGSLSERITVWKSRLEGFHDLDAAIERRVQNEQEEARRTEEAHRRDQAQQRAEAEVRRDELRAAAEKEKETQRKIEEKKKGFLGRGW